MKAFVDTVGIKSTNLKDKFFFPEFCGFPINLDVGKGYRQPYASFNDKEG